PRHVGGVHGPEGPSVEALTNHLVLTVSGLSSAGNELGVWYVDVGLGDALHDTVPLVPATFTQGPFTLSLEQTDDGVGDWHLTHDPLGTFPGMSWRMRPATIDEFADRHEVLSTSPDSGSSASRAPNVAMSPGSTSCAGSCSPEWAPAALPRTRSRSATTGSVRSLSSST